MRLNYTTRGFSHLPHAHVFAFATRSVTRTKKHAHSAHPSKRAHSAHASLNEFELHGPLCSCTTRLCFLVAGDETRADRRQEDCFLSLTPISPDATPRFRHIYHSSFLRSFGWHTDVSYQHEPALALCGSAAEDASDGGGGSQGRETTRMNSSPYFRQIWCGGVGV